MGDRRGRRRARTRLAVLACAVGAGCGPDPDTTGGRALLIGIDGAHPPLVAELMARGELPHLAGLAERGASGVARSLDPILSPRIWTTMVTGKLPEVHGIEHFARTGPDGVPRLYTSLDRKVPAVWSIASAEGLRVGVVNWLMSQPPEKLNGVMISDHAAPGALRGRLELAAGVVGRPPNQIEDAGRQRGFTWPPGWAARFQEIQAKPPPVDVPDPFAGETGPLWERLSSFTRRDGWVTRAALEIEAEGHPDLLLVYLNGIDAVSHLFWAALGPAEAAPPVFRRPEAVRRRQRDALLAYYRYTDALVGALAARYGPEDLVLVVSDHGFELARPGDKTPGVHFTQAAIDGVVFAAGRGIRAGSRVTGMRVTDVAPALLAWLGLPVGADMSGRVPGFLEVEDRTVASWDGVPVEHAEAADASAEDAILEQLRALGYLE